MSADRFQELRVFPLLLKEDGGLLLLLSGPLHNIGARVCAPDPIGDICFVYTRDALRIKVWVIQ
ncbi:hypothetical protein T265_07494 [Opisthorchis viverrini]|uniref:Uncharacterized protein n=1 Tax=Opisthorchis viverrini TaxID=6198 RepID=A0A075ABG3_OPIVI|nr:hypothetical protein T265_07494 [Opisthorchis viverrini]KER24989.1 hypothetical protein T265_07494 [Opisthorchis viverrini]